MNNSFNVIVIGGGAAGFFAAIQIKAQTTGASVVILESAVKPLGKVKISGGGRCNVTHHCFDPNQLIQFYPRGQRELKSVFHVFGPKETMAWFEKRGVSLKVEKDGRVFPITDDSETIIDCLVEEAVRLGVKIHTRSPVQTIQVTEEGCFLVQTPKETYQSNAVVLSPGGSLRAYEWLQGFEHQVVNPVPSLFTFQIEDNRLNDLAGVSFPQVVGTVLAANQKPIQQEGPLLITHWGLSGPVILRLSAWGARVLAEQRYKGVLKIDFCPNHSEEALRQAFLATQSQYPKRQVSSHMPEDLQSIIPKRYWQKLVEKVVSQEGLQWANLSKKELQLLLDELKRASFTIQGKGAFKEEFVTAGGVDLKEVDFKTMESKKVPNLYFAGEILNVDGLTGGFNFQNAWSTGWIAGNSLGLKIDRYIS